MFQSLIQPPEASQQIIAKIARDLIAKYELRQLNNPHEFANDVNLTLQQMRLYNTTLQQLHNKNSANQYKLLVDSHQQSFKIIDFLAKMIRKVYSKASAEGYTNHHYKQNALCDSCNNHIQHKNIKQLQSEILDQHLYSYHQTDRAQSYEANDGLDDQRFATPQQLLMKKMVKIQKNINQRQVNLLRCIDDFENIRIDLLIGIKKRQFDKDFSTFDLKAYSIELTKHFVSNLNRIEDKIGALKRNVHVLEDKGIQVNIQANEMQGPAIPKIEPLLSKAQHSRAQADVRKLNEIKAKLQDTCKRYQVQLKEVNIKLQFAENQIRILREQVSDEKFKNIVKEKTMKIAEKSEQKQKKQDPDKLRKESLMMMLNSEGILTGQFTNNFIENYIVNTGKRDEEMMPIIKATFKRTFDNFFSQRMSLNISNIQRKPFIKHESVDEPTIVDKRRRSKKKSMRFQLDSELKESRFAQKKHVNSTMTISTQLNYKIVFQKPALPARSSIQKNASVSSYKKSMLYTQGSMKKRKNRNSKLNSILTQYKQNEKDDKKQSFSRHSKKFSQDLQVYQTNDMGLQLKTMQRKMKKTKLSRNFSQFFDMKDNIKELEFIPSLKIKSVNISTIDSHAIKQFLFINEGELEEQNQANPSQNKKMHKFSIESLTSETPHRKEKTILNLQELNYLTQFYSLLAKLHIVNVGMYLKLKEWIFSKVQQQKMKDYQSKHSLILKKIISEIVFKHRQCRLSSSLCPHLLLFLREIEKCLCSQQD